MSLKLSESERKLSDYINKLLKDNGIYKSFDIDYKEIEIHHNGIISLHRICPNCYDLYQNNIHIFKKIYLDIPFEDLRIKHLASGIDAFIANNSECIDD